MINTINGRIILSSEIPAAFIASSSKRSPKLPKVISAANKIANGNEAALMSGQNKRKIVQGHSFPILFPPSHQHTSIGTAS